MRLKREEPDAAEIALLLRAIRAVNETKYLPADHAVFENLVKDVFPGVDPPARDFSSLREGLHSYCYQEGLQPTDIVLNNVIKLQDTLELRHGVCLLGPPYAAKTVVRNAVAAAESAGSGARVVKQLALNPKAIRLAQLYGCFDPLTREWSDGVMASLFREMNKPDVDKSSPRNWLVLDGPIDAIWVENLNTLLDDNKLMSLADGERIRLKPGNSVVFEVQDVAVASPATISRLGI
eukprot:127622-Prymnesium_polylepis.1